MPSFPIDTVYVLKERLKSFLPQRNYDDFESGYQKTEPSSRYEDMEGGPISNFGLLESEDMPPPEQPPLRAIDKYIRPECPCLSKRYTVAVLTCLGFIITFGQRCNMGMAKLQAGSGGGNSSVLKTHQMFNWSVATESAVDASFFWGYLITQVPGGFLASIFPANRIFGCAVCMSACLNMLVPGVSRYPNLLIIVRIFQGLVEGVTYPACHGIWRHWAPPLERSRLATLALCGSYAGVVIGMPLTGLFIRFIGMESAFYFYSLMGMIWFVCWNWLVFEKPSKHPTISMAELTYIEKSLGQTLQMPMPTLFSTPWRDILHSPPVYAIIVANFCRSWCFYLLVLYQAKYYQDSFNMDVAVTGFVGALPHLFMTSIVPSGGLLADHLRKRGILTTTMVRKLFNCGGFGMEAFFFIVVACSDTAFAATVALTFGVAFSGFAISGFNVNHLDIAPQYASILMGVSNGIGTMAGFILPVVVDYITRDHLRSSWKKVFVLAATVHFVGVCFYGTFASGELQHWAVPSGKEQNKMEEFGNGGPPNYEETTRQKIRVVKYGSTEQSDSLNYSRQISEERVQPGSEDVYMNEQRSLQGESRGDTNPFRQQFTR